MTARIGAVLENFKTVIEAIAPVDSTPGRLFVWYDGERLSADQSAGMTRAFTVRWLGSEMALGTQDMAVQYREHDFLLEVAFSNQYEALQRQKTMLSDAFDLQKALRNPADFPSNCDTRFMTREESAESGQTMYLRQRYRCAIYEEE